MSRWTGLHGPDLPERAFQTRCGRLATLEGGGGGTTTTNSVTQPWTGQQPYLRNMFGQAQNVYNQFSGNPSSSVAGFTPMQNQAMGATQNMANASDTTAGVNATNAAANYTTNLANGAYLGSNPGNSTFSSISNGSLSNNPGNAAYSQFANGSMLNNPYMQGMANAANTNIINAYQTATAPQTTSEFEGAGRYGSGAMMNAQNMAQQGLATQLSNAQNNLYGSMYNQNMSNMLTGASGLSQNYATAGNQQLSGAQGLSQNYDTATQQQLAGALNAPAYQTASSNLLSNLYNMGGNQQALAQQQINAPWSLLNNYAGLVGGMQYGSQSSTSQPYYQNKAMGALGGAAAGAELGSVVPGIGTGIGAVAGGLLGYFSDRRLKRDIKRVGTLDNGLGVYSYRYVWGGPTTIGVMADEVRKVKPHAVFRVGDYDAVNYGAL